MVDGSIEATPSNKLLSIPAKDLLRAKFKVRVFSLVSTLKDACGSFGPVLLSFKT